MRNPAILFAALWLVLVLNLHAQSRLDSFFDHIRGLDPPATERYIHQVFQSQDTLWDDVIREIDKHKATIPPGNLAIVYARLGQHEVSSKNLKAGYNHLREAHRMAQEAKGFPLLMFYYRYAAVFRGMHRLDSAIFYGRKTVDLAKELKRDTLEIDALNQLGYLYYDAAHYPQSVNCFKEVLRKSQQRVDKRNAYNTIGLCFRNLAVYDSALIYFQPALQYAANDTLYLGLVYGNIGDTYFLQKKYHEALPYLQTELKYTSNYRLSRITLDCMNTLAEVYLHIGDQRMATFYFDSLAHHMNGIHAGPSVKQNYYKLSSEYYRKKGDYKRAMESVQLYYQFKDSIATMRSSQAAAQVSAQYDFDAQRKEIESLQQLSRIQEAEGKQKSFLLMGSLVITLLIMALLVVVYNNYKQKKESYQLVKQHSDYVEQVNEELRVNMEIMEEKNKQIFDLAGHLQQVNASKDKMFSIISHDLRNPITSLKALLSLVASNAITKEEFVQFSGKLKEGVSHIEFTMNNLLQWARSQMHGVQTNLQSVDLHKLAEENINFLRDSAHAKSIELTNTIEGGICAFADKDHVNLVIRNLTSNAIKFTRENGKVTLNAKINAEKNMVTLTIKDTGTGMDEDTLNSLFMDDRHVTTQGTHGEKGSGLGLRLCKEMVENNNGRLWVESLQGKGSTFFVALPLS